MPAKRYAKPGREYGTKFIHPISIILSLAPRILELWDNSTF